MSSYARARSSSIPRNMGARRGTRFRATLPSVLRSGVAQAGVSIGLGIHSRAGFGHVGKSSRLDWFDSNAKLAIKHPEILDDGFGGIALANMGPGGLSQPGAQRLVREHGNDRSGERLRLSRVYQQAIDAI